MDIQKRIEEMKTFQSYLLDFLDKNDESKENLENISKLVSSHKKDQEIKLFLIFIQKVIHHHHRSANFKERMIQIFILFKDNLPKSVKEELFNIFKKDKFILFILYEQKLLTISECPYLRKFSNNDDSEAKKLIDKGQNDSYICELIRNDSIDEFIFYTNKNNISLKNSRITESIYETNRFLIGKKPSLIEYAAFFGSTEIYKYLKINEAEITPSIFLYGIHSNNPEMIHLIVENQLEFSYPNCLKEAIKCHHNEVAEYIQNNLIDENEKSDIDLYAIKYYNYRFYSSEIINNFEGKFLFNLCKFRHYFLVANVLSKATDKSIVNCTIKIPYKSLTNINSYDQDYLYYDHTSGSQYDYWTDWSKYDHDEMIVKRNKTRNKWKSRIYEVRTSPLIVVVENGDRDILELFGHCKQTDFNIKRIRYYDVSDCIQNDYLDVKREELTALHIVAENGDYQTFLYLVLHTNIDVNIRSIDCYPSEDETREMNTPFHIAMENDNIEIAEDIITSNNFDPNEKSIFERWWRGGKEEYSEKTPLILAIEKNSTRIVKELISYYSTDVNKKVIEFYTSGNLSYVYKQKKTPLHFAIEHQNFAIVETLLKNDASVNAFSVKDYRYYEHERRKQLKSPLFLAIEKNNVKIVQLLLSFHEIDIKNGLINIGGGDNMRYCSFLGKYNPKIRKDIQEETNINKIRYLNTRKDNFTDSGYFSEYKKEKNDKRYLEMVEEEDVDDDFCYNYKVSEVISPMDLANQIDDRNIKELLEMAIDDKKRAKLLKEEEGYYEEEEEELILNDDHIEDYHNFIDEIDREFES